MIKSELRLVVSEAIRIGLARKIILLNRPTRDEGLKPPVKASSPQNALERFLAKQRQAFSDECVCR
jgi:hypothetical protein